MKVNYRLEITHSMRLTPPYDAAFVDLMKVKVFANDKKNMVQILGFVFELVVNSVEKG